MVAGEQETADVVGKDIFTDRGSYCGKASDLEIDLGKFRVRALVVDAAKGSYLATVVGGKKGVIVPYPMIKAVDDIILIKHITSPVSEDEMEPPKAE